MAEITAASTEAAAALKVAERRLAEMAVLIKDVTTCKELHPLLQEYQRAADKKQFRRKPVSYTHLTLPTTPYV